jgi:hypothetical protein
MLPALVMPSCGSRSPDWLRAANRPNSISRVLSGCNSKPNFATVPGTLLEDARHPFGAENPPQDHRHGGHDYIATRHFPAPENQAAAAAWFISASAICFPSCDFASTSLRRLRRNALCTRCGDEFGTQTHDFRQEGFAISVNRCHLNQINDASHRSPKWCASQPPLATN